MKCTQTTGFRGPSRVGRGRENSSSKGEWVTPRSERGCREPRVPCVRSVAPSTHTNRKTHSLQSMGKFKTHLNSSMGNYFLSWILNISMNISSLSKFPSRRQWWGWATVTVKTTYILHIHIFFMLEMYIIFKSEAQGSQFVLSSFEKWLFRVSLSNQ